MVSPAAFDCGCFEAGLKKASMREGERKERVTTKKGRKSGTYFLYVQWVNLEGLAWS